MPTFGSLFAGIGGIDLGLERAGWECRWQVEWDAWCQHRLAQHYDVPRWGDICAIDWSGVERVDLLAGGFPCQPISSAGRQKAQGDERWLWPEFHRAIRDLRPSYVLVENVTNLLAIADGSAFGEVVGDLAALGYDSEWDCIPASAVGAPHDRDRVWIVAYPNGDRLDDAGGWQGGPVRQTRRPALAPSEHGSDRRTEPVRGAGSALADANSVRLQGERGGGLSDNGHPSLGHDAYGRRGALADTDRSRLEGRIFQSERTRERLARARSLVDAASSGLPESAIDIIGATRQPGPERRSSSRGGPTDEGFAQPGLGGIPDGLPGRLDIHRWPARPGQPQYEWEAPRVARDASDRVRRLKGLGNAVVPQVVQVIGELIREIALEQAA